MGVFKSADDGDTWAQVDVDKLLGDYNSTNSTFIPGAAVDRLPSVLHISYNFYVFGFVTQISQLNIARFDMAGDVWLADTMGPDYSGLRYNIGYAKTSQLGFRSDSTVVLFYLHTLESPPIDFVSGYRVWTAAGGEQISPPPRIPTPPACMILFWVR